MSLVELRRLITRHASPATTTAIGGVHVARTTAPAAPAAPVGGPVLAVIAQGEKTLVFDDRELRYGAGQYVVASLDLPVTGRFTGASEAEPALGFGLTLKPALIAELLLHPAARNLPGTARGAAAPFALTISDAAPELIDAVVRMLRLLERPRDRVVLAPLVEREILWLLITGPHGEAVRQLGLADSSLSSIARAVRWLRDHYAQPLRVQELAQVAAMSPSAFHRAFAAVTALSPIQFQKRIRLQEARLRLLADPADVAGAGHAVGYGSASQFSREYRRLFGLPPGQDAARLRAQAYAGV